MILLKILNVLCIGLILSTSIVDGKGKISSGKKTSSKAGSPSSSPSSSHRRVTTSRPITRTTSRPILKQTSRPIESSRYPTQPPFNPHYKPQPQPHYPQPQPHYPQPHYPQPHYPQQQPHYPQTHYPSSNYPQQNNYYPHQTQHNYPSWNNQPKKSNVGRNIATHAIAGLGGAYVGHQIGKHNSWYEKKQYERQREREREREQERQRDLEFERTGSSSGGTIPKSRTNTNGLDRLKPITPFKVNDIQSDFVESKHATGNGFKMLNDVHTRYNNDPQKNEIAKAAEANTYLNMKLRPSKSETIPKKNYTTEELQAMMLTGGGMALVGGALGAVGGAGVMGTLSGSNPIGVQPNNPAGVPSGVISVTPDTNSTQSNLQVPAVQQPTTNFTITGGQSILQTNQTQTPYKIPLTDPQVLPLVLKKVESDEKLDKKRKTSGSNSISTISNALIFISIVVIKKLY